MPSNPRLSEDLGYFQNHYQAAALRHPLHSAYLFGGFAWQVLNFNDVPMGMMTLFVGPCFMSFCSFPVTSVVLLHCLSHMRKL